MKSTIFAIGSFFSVILIWSELQYNRYIHMNPNGKKVVRSISDQITLFLNNNKKVRFK